MRRITRIIKFIILFCMLYFIVYTCDGQDANATIINIHYARSVRFYKNAQYDKAVGELERILEIEPQHIKAQKFLAKAIKRRDKATAYRLYDEAKKYYKQRDYQKALEAYQEVLKIIPSDGYAQYNLELLKAKIEKLEEISQNKQKKEKLRSAALEKRAAKKEALTKKKIASELARREKQMWKEKARQNVKEDVSKREQKEIPSEENLESEAVGETKPQESEKAVNIKTDLDKLEHLRAETDKEFASKLDSLTQEKNKEKAAYLPEELSEPEKSAKVKLFYAVGKSYYNKAKYSTAIERFQQVIDIENNERSHYSRNAKKYITKAKERLNRQMQKDRLKQIKEIEKEMMDRISQEKEP